MFHIIRAWFQNISGNWFQSWNNLSDVFLEFRINEAIFSKNTVESISCSTIWFNYQRGMMGPQAKSGFVIFVKRCVMDRKSQWFFFSSPVMNSYRTHLSPFTKDGRESMTLQALTFFCDTHRVYSNTFADSDLTAGWLAHKFDWWIPAEWPVFPWSMIPRYQSKLQSISGMDSDAF